MPYFSGQGRVYIGARDTAGNPQGLSFVGNVPELKVSLSVETLEHQESTSGQRLTDLQLIKTKKGEFACTLEELIAVNLGLALYGTTIEQVSGTVTPGMTVAQKFLKNRKMTMTTRAIVSSSVNSTSCTDAWMVWVRSTIVSTLMDGGTEARACGINLLTLLTVSMTFAPACLKIINMMPFLPFWKPSAR